MTRNRKLELLTKHFGKPVKIIWKDEYPVLTIDGQYITSGTEEVNERINQLIRENGLEWE